MVKCFYNNNILECKEFKAFGFIDDIADTVFDLLTRANEIRTKDECRTYIKVLYPGRTGNRTRSVHLTSCAVLRKIVRKRAHIFSPWADTREKEMIRDAQRLGLRMFRIRRA